MKTIKLGIVGQRTEYCFHSLILRALSSVTNQTDLHKVHSLIVVSGQHQSTFFSGKLISKYSQFKDPVSSLSIFRINSPTHNVYLWNTIIRAMTHNGLWSKALDFYTQMRKLNVKPDNYTFPSIINSCGSLLDLEMVKIVHNDVLEMGFGSDLYICNALIDMYSRMNELGRAREVFDKMPSRDVVSWNSLVSGYSANGYWEEALEAFREGRLSGVAADAFTVSSVLPACGGLMEVEQGQIVHGLVEKSGIKGDIAVSNGLLSMYFKFERLLDCQRIFDEMIFRDIVTWNIIICGFSHSGLYQESIKLFREMVYEYEPDLLTVTSVLQACGHMGDLRFGRYVHDYILENRYECDTTACNIIINMYARCGDLVAARQVFDNMKRWDLVSWNSMISGYFENGFNKEAVDLLKMMRIDLQPDSVTFVTLLSMCTELMDVDFARELHCDIIKRGYDSTLIVGNALLDVYAKCGKMEHSVWQFEIMSTRDIVTWNTIIAACSHYEESYVGLKMLSRMRMEGIMPDVATILGSLPLCSLLAAKRQGKELHGFIIRLNLESQVPVGNALIEMYSKTGSLKNAILVFEHMRIKDVVTWTAMISAYGMYGEGKKALRSFQQMKETGTVLDHIVFVAVIYACSHSGLVQDGRACFNQMRKKYNIEPRIEHYACMVDLLSRSGLLVEAEDFILSMPLQPDASMWGSLLSACRASGDTGTAERVVERLVELNSDDPGYNVLASNVYASLGKWDQVRTIRKSLKARGLRKDPGCSWIEICNRVFIFGTGDRSFQQFKQVNELIEDLNRTMDKEGYVADLKFVLHDVGEDEKINLLYGHSERLAIAFGLLNTKEGSPLQVMKNLRVCGDCHTWTKYVSKIVQREILVRDANRFHLFKDGTCSCRDRW
ncbi:pentatricopeptide repeat-containing protein At3g03580 [Solanum tuberosum]|uniref:Pentatricopeptide repeat-containing protein n=1 Tax=Solanum tuberosum TaxID=4113 RepID=M0ZNI4_SOLTU|nr:PREDICTED: pentatricopeptide repeat-containing protein At3g03580 [Solanum tuberosum]XP_015167408.1 PREDICTED: pentatricopeptide repeat-containing protein At3g03580 [Solanum tuberosum]XP_015167409.1 PREDICTED: pentatricopeptide repeat-containing protein At3g03580 [Solanum tuberosum]XP_015167410.1 PREDICTED: pentatricopeptide repeat-containing protein At3g03580 [Solanum tuberosum]